MAIELVAGQVAQLDTLDGYLGLIEVAFPGSVTAGNLIVVQSGNGDAIGDKIPTAVNDDAGGGAGNTYTVNVVTAYNTDSDQRVSGHYAKNIANGGSCTVTVSYGEVVNYRHIFISEFKNVLTTSEPLDKAIGGTGSGTTYSSTAQTTTVDGELVYGGEGNGSGTVNLGTSPNFSTIGSQGSNYANRAEYLIQASQGSIAAQFTGGSSNYCTIMMTFKPAAASGVTISVPQASLTVTGASGATQIYQVAVPVSEVTDGTWLPSTGADLYATLDDDSDSDYDYVSGNSTMEVKFKALSDPSVSSGHTLNYRIKGNGAATITVYLVQGNTVIATYTHAAEPAVLATYSRTLTGGEADAITDYSDLRIRVTTSA